MITSIPIINLERISSGIATPNDWEEIAGEIRAALHDVGFMYLTNHGVPSDIVR